jgi:hypothetical protein
MQIKPYRKSFFKHLIGMLQTQSFYDESITPETTPAIGFMVFEDKVPVAAGFLRRVEGGYAQFDGFTSNAQMPSHKRHDALEYITTCLLNTAESLNVKSVFAFTEHDVIVQRAIRHGFHRVPHLKFISKELR